MQVEKDGTDCLRKPYRTWVAEQEAAVVFLVVPLLLLGNFSRRHCLSSALEHLRTLREVDNFKVGATLESAWLLK